MGKVIIDFDLFLLYNLQWFIMRKWAHCAFWKEVGFMELKPFEKKLWLMALAICKPATIHAALLPSPRV